MASDAKPEDKAAAPAPETKETKTVAVAQGEDDEFEDFPVDGTSFVLYSRL